MVGDSLFNLISTTKTIKKGVAVYGQTNFKMAKKWQLTLGIRSDYEKVEQSVLGIFTHEPDNTPYITTPETSSSTHFNALSPKLALDYQWNDNVLLYSQYSRGFRTGGLSPLSSDPSQPALMEYKPEYSNNFEIGLKSGIGIAEMVTKSELHLMDYGKDNEFNMCGFALSTYQGLEFTIGKYFFIRPQVRMGWIDLTGFLLNGRYDSGRGYQNFAFVEGMVLAGSYFDIKCIKKSKPIKI
jgi:outer membrane receptor for Fe3+-dicitrate